jgi:hypothetical protein
MSSCLCFVVLPYVSKIELNGRLLVWGHHIKCRTFHSVTVMYDSCYGEKCRVAVNCILCDVSYLSGLNAKMLS